MISLYWWAYTPWMRLSCRLFRRHRPDARTTHGYLVAFFQRCWGYSIERLPEVLA